MPDNPITVKSEQVIEQTQRRAVLETYLSGALRKGSTTPSIKNLERWRCVNTAPITITDFLDGGDWQNLFLLGDGKTTLAHNTNIKLIAGVNKLLLVNRVYHLQYVNGLWIEVG